MIAAPVRDSSLSRNKNELSQSDLRELLNKEVREKHGDETFVQDVFSKWLVYSESKTEKLFRQDYSLKKGRVSLGNKEEVTKVTEYVPVKTHTGLGGVELNII